MTCADDVVFEGGFDGSAVGGTAGGVGLNAQDEASGRISSQLFLLCSQADAGGSGDGCGCAGAGEVLTSGEGDLERADTGSLHRRAWEVEVSRSCFIRGCRCQGTSLVFRQDERQPMAGNTSGGSRPGEDQDTLSVEIDPLRPGSEADRQGLLMSVPQHLRSRSFVQGPARVHQPHQCLAASQGPHHAEPSHRVGLHRVLHRPRTPTFRRARTNRLPRYVHGRVSHRGEHNESAGDGAARLVAKGSTDLDPIPGPRGPNLEPGVSPDLNPRCCLGRARWRNQNERTERKESQRQALARPDVRTISQCPTFRTNVATPARSVAMEALENDTFCLNRRGHSSVDP